MLENKCIISIIISIIIIIKHSTPNILNNAFHTTSK